jgi:hypothetical protein
MQLAAANAGLLVVAVLEVEMQELAAAGYRPGGRGVRREAKISAFRQDQGLLAHVLVRERDATDEPLHAAACACTTAGTAIAARSEVSEMEGCDTQVLGMGESATVSLLHEARGVAPLAWAFDNSFWVYMERPWTELELELFCRSTLGEEAEVLRGPPDLFDVWESPCGRRARTYKFTYSSSRFALSRDRALTINRRLCAAIVGMGDAELREPAPENPVGEAQLDEAPSAGRAGNAAMSMVAEGGASRPALSSRSAAECSAGGVIATPGLATAHRAPMCGGRWRQSDD